MNIGIIGTGEMGICLATKFVKHGHTVWIANFRGAKILKPAGDLGAEAATVQGTIRDRVITKRKADETLMKPDHSAYLKGMGD